MSGYGKMDVESNRRTEPLLLRLKAGSGHAAEQDVSPAGHEAVNKFDEEEVFEGCFV